MTRAEHLAWSKARALEYVELGDFKSAVASMGSDLSKHPETLNHAGPMLGVMLLVAGKLSSAAEVRDWIEGHN